jgi:hypothetical protein
MSHKRAANSHYPELLPDFFSLNTPKIMGQESFCKFGSSPISAG